jgi:hypothetical protein
MAGAVQLPLVISPTIANVWLYHTLIDGGAALNLISLAAFQKLMIPMSRLAPSCLFLGVGPSSIIPRENYSTESVIFNVVEINLPFNAITSRLACTS